ncbi:MAG: caspase family protein [Wenzhouxiangella sp.]
MKSSLYFCLVVVMGIVMTWLLSGCASSPGSRSIGAYAESYPRFGPNPDTVFILRSNVDMTDFYVDDEKVGTGRVLRVLLDRRQSYTVAARPSGYFERVDFLQPPYYSPNYLNFFFMIGDRVPEEPALTARSEDRQQWTAPAGRARGEHDVAVIVANRVYQSPGVPDVRFAHRDAEAMHAHLIQTMGFREDNVLMVKDATQGGLTTLFGSAGGPQGRLMDFIRPGESEVFVYYVGHGAPDLDGGGAFLVPVDANPEYIRNSGYSLDLFYRNLDAMGARRVTVVLDTCFSGRSHDGWLFQNISPALVDIQVEDTQSPGISVFTSASDDQVSAWHEAQEHSLFTYYFMRGMSGEADLDGDGVIRYEEMAQYLTDRVPHSAARIAGIRQHPSFQGSDGVLATLIP